MNWYFLHKHIVLGPAHSNTRRGNARDHLLEALESGLHIRPGRDVVLDLIDEGRIGDTPRVCRGRRFSREGAMVSGVLRAG